MTKMETTLQAYPNQWILVGEYKNYNTTFPARNYHFPELQDVSFRTNKNDQIGKVELWAKLTNE